MSVLAHNKVDHMELTIYNKENKAIGKQTLPSQFSEPIRFDLIKRAVLAAQHNRRQPYGAHDRAGKRHSAKLSRRRKNFKTSYGIGISRVPRKIMSGKGTRWNWVGAIAPGTRGGRRAHPPKASKQWTKKINNKERLKAIRSALHATMDRTLVQQRGHQVPEQYPFILADDFEHIAKTKELVTALHALGFHPELKRAAIKKVRAGKGKARNRKYKKRKSLLLVTSGSCKLLDSATNIAGIEAMPVHSINAQLLAPGKEPGRAMLLTTKALERLTKEKLYVSL